MGYTVVLLYMEHIKRDTQGRAIEGTCHCGTAVELGHFTCECEGCGQLYNWGGQTLRPEHEWEEDY